MLAMRVLLLVCVAYVAAAYALGFYRLARLSMAEDRRELTPIQFIEPLIVFALSPVLYAAFAWHLLTRKRGGP